MEEYVYSEMVLTEVEWIHLAQDTDENKALVNTEMKLQVLHQLNHEWRLNKDFKERSSKK
jgi:hypothetical protein